MNNEAEKLGILQEIFGKLKELVSSVETKEMGLEERAMTVRRAFHERFHRPQEVQESMRIVKVEEEQAIIKTSEGAILAVPYEFGEDGKVTFGELVSGEMVFNPDTKEFEAKAVTKTDRGMRFTAQAFLVVPDTTKPSTWKLRIQETPGNVSVPQLGRAAAALGPGFRGQRVDLPTAERRSASKKLIALYRENEVSDKDIPPYMWGLAGMKAPEQKGFSSFIPVVKAADGRDLWVAFSSTAFFDREDEIISRKAMDYGIAHADKTGERGPLRLLHLPGADVGRCEVQLREGCMLIEAGPWDETPMAEATKATLAEHPDDWMVSVGYLYNPELLKDGVYEDEVIFRERSIVSAGKSANPFTMIDVVKRNAEAKDMSTEQELKALLGDDLAQQVLEQAGQKTEEIAQNVAFKSKDKPEEEAVGEKAEEEKAVTDVLDGMSQADLKVLFAVLSKKLQGKKETDEEEETEEKELQGPAAIEITDEVVKAIAAEVGAQLGLDEKLAALAGTVETLTASFAAQAENVKSLTELANADIDAEVKRRVNGLPAARFVLAERDKVYRQTRDGEEGAKDVLETIRQSPFATDPRYAQMQSAQH